MSRWTGISKNKYRNVKTYVGDELLDSRKEAHRYTELKLLQRGGVIAQLERQRRFELQPGYVNNQGKKVLPIYYQTDFYYWDNDRQCWVAEDVKSPATRENKVYILKKKMFGYVYPGVLFLET